MTASRTPIAALLTVAVLTALTALAGACSPEAPPDEAAPEPTPGEAAGEAPPGLAAGGGDTRHEYAYLEDETERLVAFLRAEGELDAALLADSVTLAVAPDGGGERRRVAGRDLVRRDAWRVGGRSFAPPPGLDRLTLVPGLHAACQPVLLDGVAPDLAGSPHVGARLAPDADAGCLRTWTVTFVFDRPTDAPRLTAALYDQWEW